jgi:hypothetical protein
MAAAPMFVSRMGVASAQILSLDATGFDQAFAPGVYRASRSLIVLDFKAARPDVSAELFIGKATGLPTWSSGRLSARDRCSIFAQSRKLGTIEFLLSIKNAGELGNILTLLNCLMVIEHKFPNAWIGMALGLPNKGKSDFLRDAASPP